MDDDNLTVTSLFLFYVHRTVRELGLCWCQHQAPPGGGHAQHVAAAE